MKVLIDGRAVPAEEASVSVFDFGVQRGFGCFEVIRSYGGEPFRPGAHLERLQLGLEALGLPVPDRTALDGWVRRQAASGGDCLVRVIVTGGSAEPPHPQPSRCIVTWEPVPPAPARLRLHPEPVPWAVPLAVAPKPKTLSYAPNMLATAAARRSGFDDALLVAPDGTVLEGPRFAVAWVVGGRLETPALDCGVLDSVTRRTALELAQGRGIEVADGRYDLDRLRAADEVMALSTVVEVRPVAAVGQARFDTGPVTTLLAAEYRSVTGARRGAGEISDGAA